MSATANTSLITQETVSSHLQRPEYNRNRMFLRKTNVGTALSYISTTARAFPCSTKFVCLFVLLIRKAIVSYKSSIFG